MRSRIRTSALEVLAIVLVFAPLTVIRAQDAAELPDAESILDRYIEVTGGLDAYRDRTTQIVRGRMEVAGAGIGGELVTYHDGDNYYTSIEMPGVGLIEAGVTDGVAWENSALMGARIRTGAERAQAVREATINAMARWRELFSRVETVGVETIGGEAAYRVVMTPEEGGAQSTFFSVDSGLALRTDIVAATQMGDIPMQVTLADYRDHAGILIPTTMTQSLAGQTVRIVLQSTEANVDIPAERFEMPAPVAALLE